MKGVRLARNERVDSLDHLGRRIIQLTGEARAESTGKLVATATSIYMNADTEKERK